MFQCCPTHFHYHRTCVLLMDVSWLCIERMDEPQDGARPAPGLSQAPRGPWSRGLPRLSADARPPWRHVCRPRWYRVSADVRRFWPSPRSAFSSAGCRRVPFVAAGHCPPLRLFPEWMCQGASPTAIGASVSRRPHGVPRTGYGCRTGRSAGWSADSCKPLMVAG